MRTVLAASDVLPLTCTRSGTCCHGKDIRISPWELAVLARARGEDAAGFRDACTVEAGTRLRLDGPPGWRGLPACSQYDPQRGCTVHAARPLACRLFPLGRERQGEAVRFIHEGSAFPCLAGCPDVATLPQLTVADYLAGQEIAPSAGARDAYLELAQDLAESAFALVFDGGLGDDEDQRWRQAWQLAVRDGAPAWPALLGPRWLGVLTAPQLPADLDQPAAWIAAHGAGIEALANQEASSAAACVRLFTGALLLIQAVGGDAREIGSRWLQQVKP